MNKDEIRAIAIEYGLDPDLWGCERELENFVRYIEFRLKKKHSESCYLLMKKLEKESDEISSPYTRAVLRQKAITAHEAGLRIANNYTRGL